jgi:hypothetical protein
VTSVVLYYDPNGELELRRVVIAKNNSDNRN